MDYETEEQQVEALKAWWRENGKAVIAGVALGAVAIGGWSGWARYQESQAVAASNTFSRSIVALQAGDAETSQEVATEIAEDQPNSLYASYANLAAARAAVETGDLETAAQRLIWVSENSPQDDVSLIAAVRLARVKAALQEVDAGLALLPTTYPDAFTGLVEEVRGDLLVAAGKFAAARTAYQTAQSSNNIANPAGLTMKINELAEATGAS